MDVSFADSALNVWLHLGSLPLCERLRHYVASALLLEFTDLVYSSDEHVLAPCQQVSVREVGIALDARARDG